ncbi:MAG: hypothetical protein M3P98_00180 [bacterium]|nr:hypothetical protein [bacterium]
MSASPEFHIDGQDVEPDSAVLGSALVYLTLVRKLSVFGPTYGEFFKKAAGIMRSEFSDDITSVVSEATKFDKASLRSTFFGSVALTLEQIGPETNYKDPNLITDLGHAQTIIEALIPELSKWGR